MTNHKDLTETIINSIQNKKGEKITVLDMTEIDSAPTSEFIICQGRSTSQVSAIADGIREDILTEYKIKPHHYDGYRNSQWIVIDYGNVMVHIFLPDFREFYSLEELWNDARISYIPDLD